MKLQIFKNIFKSLLFFLKHILLFVILNSILYYLFNSFFYGILNNFFGAQLNTRIGNDYITSSVIFYIFLMITKIIIKLSFYTIAINNDIEDIGNDITIYLGDFVSNILYIFLSGYTFVIFGVILVIIPILPPFYLNFCCFFMMYTISKRKSGSDERYKAVEAISESFSITNGSRIKIMFFNTIIMVSCVLGIYFMPERVVVHGLDISYILELLIVDFLLVYIIRTGFDLDKIENDKVDQIINKELNNSMDMLAATTNAKIGKTLLKADNLAKVKKKRK